MHDPAVGDRDYGPPAMGFVCYHYMRPFDPSPNVHRLASPPPCEPEHSPDPAALHQAAMSTPTVAGLQPSVITTKAYTSPTGPRRGEQAHTGVTTPATRSATPDVQHASTATTSTRSPQASTCIGGITACATLRDLRAVPWHEGGVPRARCMPVWARPNGQSWSLESQTRRLASIPSVAGETDQPVCRFPS
jgi:hypothetical protein